jgi:predicted Zn-ribbon and HTH transcriptional regulator
MSKIELEKRIVKCRKCGHEWIPHLKSPKICPKCKSPRWQEPKNIKKCLRCGHTWKAIKDEPLECPKCKSVYWNEKRD